jgi:hypothetical protein
MKRSTLILLLVAAVAGALVYFLEFKDAKPRDEKADASKPAFAFKREDLAAITVTRAGKTVMVENQDNKWVIKQPVTAPADQSALDSLVGDIANAKVERNLAASAEEIKSYGLQEPAVTLEVKLKNGEQHRLRLGAKDFSGLSVYGLVDDTKEVALLPASLLTSADKSLDDLRDRAVLGVTQYEMGSVAINNEHGRVALAKQDSNWVLKSPVEAPADEGEVSSLLGDVTSAKAAEFVSEAGDDLAKFGLDKPKVTFTAQLQGGGERSLLLGNKDGERYFAKNSERPQIFKVESALYDKLNLKPAGLRSKEIVKLNKDDLTRVEIKNPNLTLAAEKDKDNKWIIKEPAELKDKEAQSYKLFDPLENNKATEVLDQPPAAVAARLAKPAAEVRLTGKDGKTTVVKVSAADGDNVYVRVDGRQGVYKVGKQMLEGLSFKAADVSL